MSVHETTGDCGADMHADEKLSNCHISGQFNKSCTSNSAYISSFPNKHSELNRLQEQLAEKTKFLQETEKNFVKLIANLQVK